MIFITSYFNALNSKQFILLRSGKHKPLRGSVFKLLTLKTHFRFSINQLYHINLDRITKANLLKY